MYTNAEMLTKTYVALSSLPTIMNKADSDKLNVRDTRDLMLLESKMPTVNSRLGGHINTRKMGFASFDWAIQDADDKLKLRMQPFIDAIIDNYINAPMFGVMGFKLKWVLTENGWAIDTVDSFEPIEIDTQGGNLIIVNEDDNNKQEVKPDNQDYFYYIYPQKARGGVLRSVIISELLRHDTIIEWKNLNLRMKGIVAGSVDVEKLQKAQSFLNLTEDQKQQLLTNLDAAISAIGTNSSIRTLDFADIQFKSLVEGTAGASFEKFKNELDADISIAILGQANTSILPSSGGSRAALNVLNLIRTDILLNDMLIIKRLVNKALVLDAKKNTDNNLMRVPYKFEWIYDDNVDIEAYARVFETIARSPVPIVVDTNEYYNKLGLTKPDGVDDTITLGGGSGGGLF